jgi:hypothetical protein
MTDSRESTGRPLAWIDPPYDNRAAAVVAVFGLAAHLTPRNGRTYDEWVREVTARFLRGWNGLEGAL